MSRRHVARAPGRTSSEPQRRLGNQTTPSMADVCPERIAARLGITLSTLTQNVRRHAPEWANAFKAAERRERGRSVSA